MSNEHEKFLIDSTTWLLFILGEEKLDKNIIDAIESASASGALYVSVFSFKEIVNLINDNQIIITKPLRQWLDEAIEASRLQIIPLTIDIIIETSRIPNCPEDLAQSDIINIATSRVEGLTYITIHENIIEYAKLKYIKVSVS